MKADMHPLSLAKANSELWLRTLGVNQGYRRCWLEAAGRYHDDVIAATQEALAQSTSAPPSLDSASDRVTLPARLALVSMNALMAMNEPLLEGQATVVRGLQQAFDGWLAELATVSNRKV